jgi:hypothetical protein
MQTTYDFNDSIHYFGDYSQLVGLLFMITCLMGPLSLYACLRDTELYANLQGPTQKLWVTLKNVSVFYIFILLFCCFMILGANEYSLGVTGTYSNSDMSIDCKDCCAVFHDCSEGVANTLDYDTYVFSQDGECPRLAEIVAMGSDDDCADSDFGCCSLRTTCDDYVRLRRPYDVYEQGIGKGYPIGYVVTGVKKLDPNGTLCPQADDFIKDYTDTMYDHHGKRVFLYICFFLFIVVSPCWVYRWEILEDIKTRMGLLYEERSIWRPVHMDQDASERSSRETSETPETPDPRRSWRPQPKEQAMELSLSPDPGEYEIP